MPYSVLNLVFNTSKLNLEIDSEKPLAVFKAARLFSPVRLHEIQPTALDLDQLKVLLFLDDSTVLSNLKVELPSYLAKASQVNSDFDILEWWKLHEAELPHWSSAVKKGLLLQPSSAASERVFFAIEQFF